MDLSEAGRRVVLIDKAFSIGGLMSKLDRTFPTNNCDLCTLSPQLSATGRRQHIELMPGTQVSSVEGEAGRFCTTLTRAPRFIDLSRCTACGECYKRYPEWVRFTPGLDHRAPTCMRYPQATPFAFSIYPEASGHLDELAQICPAGAIMAGDHVKVESRTFGAIIVAVGTDLFAPARLDYLSRGLSPDVLTGMEYERILSASGPTSGELKRPSDGTPPRRIAWIQCVGSRGINSHDVSYCSSVCCMSAIKEAVVTRERFGNDIETSIFYMDIRTGGKDYELYYQRAIKEYGVRFVRCRPHSVVRDDDGALRIAYILESGHLATERFDMVVLSSGFRCSAETGALAQALGIELNRHQFAEAGGFSPVSTSRPGVYVCGTFEGPKDIPETIVQSSAAACLAMAAVGRTDGGSLFPEEIPPERDIAGEPPRIGVFVCDCGFNIGGVIDVEAVVAHAGTLDGVVVAERAGHGCSSAAMERIEKHHSRKGVEPGRDRRLFPSHPRKGVPEHAAQGRPEQVPDGDRQHPRPERLGPRPPDRARYREGQRPGAHGGRQHPLSPAPHRPRSADQQGRAGGGGWRDRHDRSVESGRARVQGDPGRADALAGRFGRTASQESGGRGYRRPCPGVGRSYVEPRAHRGVDSIDRGRPFRHAGSIYDRAAGRCRGCSIVRFDTAQRSLRPAHSLDARRSTCSEVTTMS